MDMSSSADPRLETLAEHAEGVRRLARQLVADPDRAEDVAQETLLLAVARWPLRAVRDIGSWLRGVVRNKAREAARAEGRRQRHEGDATLVARREAPDPSDVAARVEASERVLALLRGLAPAYRDVLWMRHFEDLTPTEIARRLGLPLETVRTRIRRATEEIRAGLDRAYDGRRSAWAGALVSLAGGKGVVSGLAATGGAVTAASAKAKVAVAVALLLAGAGATALALATRGAGSPSDDARSDAQVPSLVEAGAAAPGALAEFPANESAANTTPGEERSPGPGLAAAGPRHVAPHEGRFQFHYEQGWSFRTRTVVPPEDADLVFKSCAGGISSVTLAVPGGGITNLSALREVLPDAILPQVIAASVLRVRPEEVGLRAEATGDDRSPHDDAFVLRTRRGEWVKAAIEVRGTGGGWTELPVTISYVLQPEGPEFLEGKAERVVAGVEIDFVPRALAAAQQRAFAHEARFQFHRGQGWSFLTRTVAPPEDADLVFESCSGGLSSVTLAVPSGKIVNLSTLRDVLRGAKRPEAITGCVLRVHPGQVRFGERARGDDRTPHEDAFVLQTRRGEWVKVAIEARGTEVNWWEGPITISYILRPDGPEFLPGKADRVVEGLEIDTRAFAAIEKARTEDVERARAEREAPVRRRMAVLDARAAQLEADLRRGGASSVQVAAVMDRKFAAVLGSQGSWDVATYSFEKASRTSEQATRSDWDFEMEGRDGEEWLWVCTATDDRSLIRDLGETSLDQVLQGGGGPGEGVERVRAVRGHAYLVHTFDTDTDLWALMRIVELNPGESMVFEWRILADPGALRGALGSVVREMRLPMARLQVRGGAGGGNQRRVYLDGSTNDRVRLVASPLSVEGRTTPDETALGYVNGGLIPVDRVFVVERIEWLARADGGHSRVLVRVGPYVVADLQEDTRGVEKSARRLFTIDGGAETVTVDAFPVRRELPARIPLRRGDERDVYVEIANSSLADVTLLGRFVSRDDMLDEPLFRVDRRGIPYLDMRLRSLAREEAQTSAFGPGEKDGLAWFEGVLACGPRGEYRKRIERWIASWPR